MPEGPCLFQHNRVKNLGFLILVPFLGHFLDLFDLTDDHDHRHVVRSNSILHDGRELVFETHRIFIKQFYFIVLIPIHHPSNPPKIEPSP